MHNNVSSKSFLTQSTKFDSTKINKTTCALNIDIICRIMFTGPRRICHIVLQIKLDIVRCFQPNKKNKVYLSVQSTIWQESIHTLIRWWSITDVLSNIVRSYHNIIVKIIRILLHVYHMMRTFILKLYLIKKRTHKHMHWQMMTKFLVEKR